MSIHVDRREIAPLLLSHFPEMEGASSDDWHAFLDQVTGLSTPLDEQNATAFDRWRQALAAMDIPVWSITPSAAATMKARGEALAQRAAARGSEDMLRHGPAGLLSMREQRTEDRLHRQLRPLFSDRCPLT